MEAKDREQEVINISDRDLLSINPMPDKVYNINIERLILGTAYANVFATTCKILASTTSVKNLEVDFWLDVPNLRLLGETMKQTRSIERIGFIIEHLIPQDAFKSFAALIQKSTTLKTIEFVILTPHHTNLELLDNIKGLYMPTRTFLLNIPNCAEDLDTHEFYQKQIEVLKTTNINHLEWSVINKFTSIVDGLKGFGEFCDHVIQQNTLKSFHPNLVINADVLPYMVKIISKSKSIRRLVLNISLHSTDLQKLLDVLANSNIEKLLLQGVIPEQKHIEVWASVAQAIRAMKKLTHVSVGGYLGIDVTQFISESIRVLIVTRGFSEDIIAGLTLRNKMLQNTRVLDTITLLFNIARDNTPSLTTIPRDIWPIIMSLVEIPGVSLDFGVIAHAIFKDKSIRRVVYKKSNV